MVALVSRQGRQLQRYSDNGRRLVVGCIPYKVNVDEHCDSDPLHGIEVLVVSSQKGHGMMFPKSYQAGQSKWRTQFALNTSGPSNNNGSQDNPSEENTGLGRTRLGIIVRAAGKQLLDKLNSARKTFPVKIFLLLLGFYTANALATILGQTGDWDVLVAGIVVAAIEGIGMLMYKKKVSKPAGRFQSFIVMVNYWKAGVCLGLFVDAFKLGS